MKLFQPSATNRSGITPSQEQKCQSILDSLELPKQVTSLSTMMQPSGSSSVQNSKPFMHSGHPETPPEYLQRQKEIKSRYPLTNLKTRLSNHDVNAIVATTI